MGKLIGIFLILSGFLSFGQETIISGSVTDSETGEPIPFVNVYLVGIKVGTTTDLEGNYRIQTTQSADSVVASYIGYISKKYPITIGSRQTINFMLNPETKELDEVLFVAPENPAWAVMRGIMRNKKQNDIKSLNSYEHDTYTKIEWDIAQMAEKFADNKLVEKVYTHLDSLGEYRDENGKPSVPIFHSESLSKLYVQNRPYLQKEEINKANIYGVGVKDKKTVSQITGVSFQQYNFYDNWMTIINKEFVSPLANGWKTFYEYYIIDSGYVDGEFLYTIEFFPKNELDLAFKGQMTVAKEDYGVKKIDAVIGSKSNLNWIEKLELYQELEKTELGPWVPVKTNFLIKISELAPNTTGLTASFLIAASNHVLNNDKPESFYVLPVEVSPDVIEEDPIFWEQIRPEPLTEKDIKAKEAIHSISKIGTINAIANAVKMVRRGYITGKYFDFGPWLYSYAHNDIEGSRIRLGVRTNYKMHEKWVISAFAAYGTKDQVVKWGTKVDFIQSKKPWTAFSIEHRDDMEQLGALDEALRKNFIFNASIRMGEMANPHMQRKTTFKMERDLIKGLQQSISLTIRDFVPLYPFAFYYDTGDPVLSVRSTYQATEVVAETRFARDELFIYENNIRYNVGKGKKPVLTFRYVKGMKDFLGGDFNYHKFGFRVEQNVGLGLFGTSRYVTEFGYIPSTVPYPLLRNHMGNNFIFYNEEAFSLMDKGEFVSDSYTFLKYSHHFQGFLLNRIPLMRKLKWRTVAAFNILYGGMRSKNRKLIPLTDNGVRLPEIQSIEDKPYMEVGYGIENILRILEFSFYHRVSYLDVEGARKFGIRLLFTVKP